MVENMKFVVQTEENPKLLPFVQNLKATATGRLTSKIAEMFRPTVGIENRDIENAENLDLFPSHAQAPFFRRYITSA